MTLSPINDAATADSPIDGFGTILEYSADDGTTWKQVANLLDIKPAGETSAKVKTTTHSTTGGVHTYRPGFGEPGEHEVTLLYDKTAYAALKAQIRQKIKWRVTYSESSTDAAEGFLTELKPVTPLEGDATIEAKIQISGVTTFTPGT